MMIGTSGRAALAWATMSDRIRMSDRSPASLCAEVPGGADWAKFMVNFGLVVEASFLAGPARGRHRNERRQSSVASPQ